MSAANKLKPAATVVLLRPAGSRGFEVLLTRGAAAMACLGGTYGFPGGGVRPDDCSPFMLGRWRGVSPETARRIIGAHFTSREAMGFWIAAARELFEKTGVLLAVDPSNHRPYNGIPEHSAGPEETHTSLASSGMDFYHFLKANGLFCNASSLLHFSHWQISAWSEARIDTRFFLAVLPQGQRVLAKTQDIEDILWLRPDRALCLFQHKKLPMIFPIFASLRTLADFDNLESVLREFSTRNVREWSTPSARVGL